MENKTTLTNEETIKSEVNSLKSDLESLNNEYMVLDENGHSVDMRNEKYNEQLEDLQSKITSKEEELRSSNLETLSRESGLDIDSLRSNEKINKLLTIREGLKDDINFLKERIENLDNEYSTMTEEGNAVDNRGMKYQMERDSLTKGLEIQENNLMKVEKEIDNEIDNMLSPSIEKEGPVMSEQQVEIPQEASQPVQQEEYQEPTYGNSYKPGYEPTYRGVTLYEEYGMENIGEKSNGSQQVGTGSVPRGSEEPQEEAVEEDELDSEEKELNLEKEDEEVKQESLDDLISKAKEKSTNQQVDTPKLEINDIGMER